MNTLNTLDYKKDSEHSDGGVVPSNYLPTYQPRQVDVGSEQSRSQQREMLYKQRREEAVVRAREEAVVRAM